MKNNDNLLEQFIERFLSLPWDSRNDRIRIAERNYQDKAIFTVEEVYGYIYWRYCLPEHNPMSWYDMFDENPVAGSEESL